MGRPVGADARQGLMRGARLQIVPELSGLGATPEDAEIEWWEPVHEVRVQAASRAETARGVHLRGWSAGLVRPS